MRFAILASVIFLFLTISCKDKRIEKIEGKWTGLTPADGTVEFHEDGTSTWNNMSKRDCRFLDEEMLEVSWMTTKKKLNVAIVGDTLTLTGPESRNKFIKHSVIEKSDAINKELIGRKIFETKQKKLLELNVEKTDLEKLKKIILFDENKVENQFKPNIQLYYATALLMDSSRVELIAQPALGMPNLDITIYETLESKILAYFNGMFIVSQLGKIGIEGKSKDAIKGTVSNDRDEKLKFYLKLGQAPVLDIQDPNTLNIALRYLMDKQLGYKSCEKVVFEEGGKTAKVFFKGGFEVPLEMKETGEWEMKPDVQAAKFIASKVADLHFAVQTEVLSVRPTKNGEFEFNFRPKNSPELTIKGILIASKADWYPIEEIKNLENTVLAQINKKNKIASSLTFKSLGKGMYEGELTSVKEGVPPAVIKLKHTGKAFLWELVRDKKNRKYSARDENDLEKAGIEQDMRNSRVRQVKPIIGMKR